MVKNFPFSIFPTFVLRAPILPFDFLEESLLRNSEFLGQLSIFVKQKEINEAIFIAAPEFHAQLQKWVNGTIKDLKEEERIQQTLYKYLTRMATRCTPFGLYAGCTTGFIGEKTLVFLADRSKHNRHTRLDMLYLCNLSSSISDKEEIKNALLYYPNTSIYESGKQVRYFEYRYKKNKRTHYLIQISNSEYLALIIEKARNGAKISELTQLLVNKGIHNLDARNFIEKLIDNQILVGELDPIVSGDEFLSKILRTIDPIEGIDQIKNTLFNVNKRLYCIDKYIGNSSSSYEAIASKLQCLNIDFEKKHLFQTDLILNAYESEISSVIVSSVTEGLITLNKLTVANSLLNIQKFKEAFLRRYETKEVSLLKALDIETGVGYLQESYDRGDYSPLIHGIILPPNMPYSNNIELNSVQKFLLDKFLGAFSQNCLEIEITDSELGQFKEYWNDLPPTFSTMIKIVNISCAEYPKGRIIMEGAGGVSATTLVGRFCHGNEKIHQLVKQIVDKEQKLHPDAIVAEIIHLPESRVGNVIQRPILRNYEIPILTSSYLGSEYKINLGDLYISVKNNEIILRSRRLNKRIIPRLSNAHNFSNNSIPVYQFLCDLQSQGLRTWVGFDWGRLLDDVPFKPRVLYKNIILSVAIWSIKKEEIKEFSKIKESQILLLEIKKWRLSRKLPEKVLLEEGDNSLFIDFENCLSIKTFLSTVKKKTSFTLKEFLFDTNNPAVISKEGAFTNEFILFFYRKDLIKHEL